MELEQLSKTEKLNISLKEISQRLRKQFKADFPNCVFSVRTEYYSMGQSLDVNIMKSDIRIKKRFDELTESQVFRYTDTPYKGFRTIESLRSMQDCTHHQLSQIHNYEEYDDCWNNGVFLTKAGFELIKKVCEMINHYNWDESDSQTDYFDVHFYLHLGLGQWDKPFIDGA